MTTISPAEVLKFAELQMAAEAVYSFNAVGIAAPTPGNPQYTPIVDGSTEGHFRGPVSSDVLLTGNDRASRFTPTEAQAFAAKWTIVDHLSNTATGFSGTLFQAIQNDPAQGIVAGEYVLSFRSTEFIDDSVRDSLGTNQLEVATHGWAFGQIADMEAWYKQLAKPGGPLDGKQFSVTGYSLGGHLATAFNLLRDEQGVQGNVDRVVTFNGAGVGAMRQGTITDAIKFFTDLRSSPEKARLEFSNTELGAAYELLRGRLADGHAPGAAVSPKNRLLRSTGKIPRNPKAPSPANEPSWQRAA